MECEKKRKKRARDDKEEDDIIINQEIIIRSSSSAKKQAKEDDDDDDNVISDVASGVFDFPWLHEEEEYTSGSIFEDTFSSSLEEYTWFEFSGHCCYRWESSSSSVVDYKFEENVLWPLKGDLRLEMDTIWRYLNQNQNLGSVSVDESDKD